MTCFVSCGEPLGCFISFLKLSFFNYQMLEGIKWGCHLFIFVHFICLTISNSLCGKKKSERLSLWTPLKWKYRITKQFFGFHNFPIIIIISFIPWHKLYLYENSLFPHECLKQHGISGNFTALISHPNQSLICTRTEIDCVPWNEGLLPGKATVGADLAIRATIVAMMLSPRVTYWRFS